MKIKGKSNITKNPKEIAIYNKKTYSKEYKELKFLVETKKADDFTISMYVAFLTGRKMTDKMLNELIAVVAMANETNRLVESYQVDLDNFLK